MAAVFKVGQRVKELAPPGRTGSVRAVNGSGNFAVIVVNLGGRAPVSFRPAQLGHV